MSKVDGQRVTIYAGGVYERRTDVNATTTHIFYVPGAEGVAAQVEWQETGATSVTSAVRYLHRDQLGSVDSATAEDGSVVDRFRYDPFGERLDPGNLPALAPNSLDDLRRTFEDHDEDDDLGLINMGGLMYDPATGRFLSPDPFVHDPLLGQSFNRYSFALNNPFRYTDPTGFDLGDVPFISNTPAEPPPGADPGPPPEQIPNNTPTPQAPPGTALPNPAAPTPAPSVSPPSTPPPNPAAVALPESKADDTGTSFAERVETAATTPNFKLDGQAQPSEAPDDVGGFSMRPTDFLPLAGPGIAAVHDFLTGHPVWGTVNALFCVIDIVTLGEATVFRGLAVSIGEAVLRAEARDVGERAVESLSTRGARAPNLSPPGAGRQGAFNAAKRAAGVPTSQQPARTLQNMDPRGEVQPGRIYEYEVPAPGGGTSTVQSRDDVAGHQYLDDPSQNRGPHFNDPAKGHYDY